MPDGKISTHMIPESSLYVNCIVMNDIIKVIQFSWNFARNVLPKIEIQIK